MEKETGEGIEIVFHLLFQFAKFYEVECGVYVLAGLLI